MDFDEILKMASQNQGYAEKELVYKKGVNTSIGKAKREPKDKAKGVKSAAVQAFLKKQEAEERKKALEDKKKKENLMKLRLEKNTVGQMNKMIKRSRTKEAIFEVEGNDKKGDEEKTPVKSDERDDKITEYTKLKSQFGGKERKAAIQNIQRKKVSAHWVPKEQREKEQQKDPDKKSKFSGSDLSDISKYTNSSTSSSSSLTSKSDKIENSLKNVLKKHEEEKAAKEEKKKKRPPGPPPMNFNDLLKLAEQKKSGTAPTSTPTDKKSEKPKSKEPKMPNRPMTQEEKDRWMRVHSKEYQDWIKKGKARPEFCQNTTPKKKRQSKGSSNPGVINPKTPAIVNDDAYHTDEDYVSDTNEIDEKEEIPSKSNSSISHGSSKQNSANMKSVGNNPKMNTSGKSKQPVDVRINGSSKMKSPVDGKTNTNGKFKSPAVSLKMKSGSNLVSGDSKSGTSKAAGSKQQAINRSASSSVSSVKSSQSSNKKSSQVPSDGKKKNKSYDEVRENVLVCGEKSRPVHPKKEEPQLSTWDRIYGQTQKKKKPKPAVGKKRVIESDSEHDSELDDFIASDEDDDMDDFIDDSEPMDISSVIGSLFGYNRNKYRYEDEEDLSDMEAGFADIEKEEKVSEQIGMLEDEEELRKEEAHRKKKLKMKKQMAKKMKMR